MDIKLLSTFLQVAETKHFGRAAENLYITQAAVSARIKQLEEFYAAPLFVRDKNNLRLTPAGDALLSHARKMVQQMEQSRQAISVVREQKTSFNIATTANVWDAFFSSRFQQTLNFFEQMSLGIEFSVREAIQRNLDCRTLDFGLLPDPIKDDDFNSQLVGEFELTLVGTAPRFEEGLSNYIAVDWGLTYQKEHGSLHKTLPVFKTSTAMIALEVMLEKSGFAYLPRALVEHYLQAGELFEVDSQLASQRPVYMVYRKNALNEQLILDYFNALTG